MGLSAEINVPVESRRNADDAIDLLTFQQLFGFCHVIEANKIIMTEMEQLNVKRLVAISVIGAGDSWTFLPWIYRKLALPFFMKWFQAIIDDKNRMEAMIMQSRLDWTIVRCTTVKERPATGKVHATLDGKEIPGTFRMKMSGTNS